ncbi:glycoside hydrolase family 127 protein [Leifsonia sp. AG29]|uniref:glycoside hydrolase family 127 protein n=1 Tax=Leifsonia sp. AG29 TaxID=2598860 RepID=UPI00131EB4BC|nr:beta-L-arabinofuranosidase domain-containing protein [Leifsonia sp. AG29]
MKTSRHVSPVLPAATDRLAVQPLGLDAVTIRSGVWADWQRDNRAVTTPHSFHWLERDGTVDNLRRLDPSGSGRPERRGPWFTDSDLYKALEAVAWDLGREDSPELAELVGDISDIIRRAQAPDGYINSFVQAGMDVRWDNLVKSHELYCIGHLIQAGIAHRRSTGRSELFDIAVAAADVVVADFGDGRRSDTDGHEEIEMALVELYRETGNRTYLDLAQQLVDVRGYRTLDTTNFGDSPYYQDATPVREETTVVGHAVRAIYLLAGVVDIAIETGEEALLSAAITQWESMTATKTYLNGAVGSRFIGEAFGDPYELPPDLAYGETCATIGNIMVSWRLLLLTGESRFADAIERALYNLFAASTAVDRKGFFYNNPAQRRTALEAAPTNTRPDRADAPGTRPAWFECACCPPNIMRTIASLGAYVSTATGTAVQLHQFLPVSIETELNAGAVRLEVDTRYPLDGFIDVTVQETMGSEWALEFRVPEWAGRPELTINGISSGYSITEKGYARVSRVWVPGDVITFIVPMEPRLTVAHPAVDAVRGAVAIERGPVVYAFESVDQDPIVDLNHVELLRDPVMTEHIREDFLGQASALITVRGRARQDAQWRDTGWKRLEEAPPSDGTEVELTAIPYALWANRGPSVMRIFIPLEASPA